MDTLFVLVDYDYKNPVRLKSGIQIQPMRDGDIKKKYFLMITFFSIVKIPTVNGWKDEKYFPGQDNKDEDNQNSPSELVSVCFCHMMFLI